MKKLLICLLLLPSLAWGSDLGQDYARMNPYILGGGVSAAAGCTVDSDKKLWNPVTQPGTTQSLIAWKAQKFVLAAEKTITGYNVKNCDNNQTGSVSLMIMNNDGSNYPNEESIVPDSTVTKAHSAIVDCGTGTVEFWQLATPITLAAGTYWVTSKEVDGADYAQYYATSTGDVVSYDAAGNGTWDTLATNTAYDIEVYGCD